MLTVRLLGPFSAATNQTPLRFRSDKTIALFAYLLLNLNAPIRRETLATLLWPETSDARARKNLRDALFYLRKTLGTELAAAHLISDNKQIRFVSSDQLLLDIEQINPTNASSWVRGELLEGFNLTSADPFIDWLIVEREKWLQHGLLMLGQQADSLLALGDAEQALTVARLALKLEPWREEAHRCALRALAAQRDWGGLRKQFDTYCATLKKELGIEPTAATRELFETLKSQRSPNRKLHNIPADLTPLFG